MNAIHENTIEYTEEFLDPLLCTPIKDPVKIPDIKDIHDRISVVSHIHESKENPYTRKSLTMEEFEEYNKLPEIMKEIELFNTKKNSI